MAVCACDRPQPSHPTWPRPGPVVLLLACFLASFTRVAAARSNPREFRELAPDTSYTPKLVYDEVTLAAVAPQPVGGPNERRGPWTVSIDVRATRELSLAGMPLEASVWVINLLDRRNANTVFTGSGSPSTTAWLATPDGKAWLQNAGPDGARLYDLAQSRPELFDAPRLVRFGLRATF